MHRVVITGTRNAQPNDLTKAALISLLKVPNDRWGDNWLLVHGGAKGVDTIAADLYRSKYGREPEVFKADWSKGKSAGPERNMKMIDAGIDMGLAMFGTCSCNKFNDRHLSHGALQAFRYMQKKVGRGTGRLFLSVDPYDHLNTDDQLWWLETQT